VRKRKFWNYLEINDKTEAMTSCSKTFVAQTQND